MVCASEGPTLHSTSNNSSTMTTSFIGEASDQELQLSDLQQLNGAMPVLIAVGYAATGWAIGAGAFYLNEWFQENREDIADSVSETVHDAISAEDDGNNVAPTGDGKSCTDRGLPF